MSDIQRKQVFSYHIWGAYTLTVVLLFAVWYYDWKLGIVMTVLFALSLYISLRNEQKRINETEKYISTISYRVKKVGEEALLEMPFGIILYNENYEIEWSNPYMNQFSDENTLVGESLHVLSDDLIAQIKEDEEEVWISLQDYDFQTVVKKSDRLLYLFDRTERVEIETKYDQEQPIIIIIYLDNYEEITRNMEDTLTSELNSKITSTLNDWSHENGLLIKRTSQERFLAIGTNEILDRVEQTKFAILDEVREIDIEHELKNPITLSIGVGHGQVDLPALGELAQSSLDLALGRGGDQVAIKNKDGQVRFYGGKTNPMEKRTRVRARVISHALKDLVKESDKVIIMGHKSPDMDSLGAAIGVLNIAQANDVAGYIVFDSNDVNTGIERVIEAIKEEDEIWSNFVEPAEAEELISSQSLIVVVDTHKPAMVANEDLLKFTDYKVVIDHHRRGEAFIEDPTLVYMEPYASSTAELVTELLEYQPNELKLSMLEATALLAGIIVDTKSFTLRTGSRTFDAASYLRSEGADTVLVQRFMKEDIDQYTRRSNLISRSRIFYDVIAIATADEQETFDQIIIAQAADTLLTMDGVDASFVISKRQDGRIGISARSLGDVNVQIIMEKLNGGGHLTNAATQVDNMTLEEAESLLKEVITQYFEGES